MDLLVLTASMKAWEDLDMIEVVKVRVTVLVAMAGGRVNRGSAVLGRSSRGIDCRASVLQRSIRL